MRDRVTMRPMTLEEAMQDLRYRLYILRITCWWQFKRDLVRIRRVWKEWVPWGGQA